MKHTWKAMSPEMHQGLLAKWQRRQDKHENHVWTNPATGGRYGERKRWLQGLCKAAGVRARGFHNLRHFYASYCYERGMNLYQIQHQMTHESARTTERYLSRLGHAILPVVPSLPVATGPLGPLDGASDAKEGLGTVT